MRATRAGPRLGALIEDVGVSVPPQDQYDMTRDDLLYENRDLLARCIGWLRHQPYTVLTCVRRRGKIDFATQGLDQLDITVGHHRLESVRIQDGAVHTIVKPADNVRVEVCGLRRGVLKQRRVIDARAVLGS
jgi:hypothetical protein